MRRWIRSLFSPLSTGPICVEQPRSESRGGTHRISLRLDGQELWFESSDIPLRASPEAFATALLIPTLSLGRRLQVCSSVCPVWLENQRRAAQITSRWWNYSESDSPTRSGSLDAVTSTESASAATCTPTTPTPHSQSHSHQKDGLTALCFTAGVDSFYTLLRAQPAADLLVFALGFDVDLRDQRLMQGAERTVRAVAAETGKRAVVITSNLRRHRTFRVESWERTHGSALGAIGHLLSDHVSLLQISSSQPYGSPTLWGSRWDLDPLFASSRLSIQHFGAEYLRTEKLWQIAGEPILQRHLRVCWVRHRGEGNCGRCEKCVRTMLVLETCGQLENYPTLGKRSDLVGRIDAIPSIPWGTVIAYNVLTQRDLRPDVRRAIERLLERTHVAIAASQSRRSAAA